MGAYDMASIFAEQTPPRAERQVGKQRIGRYPTVGTVLRVLLALIWLIVVIYPLWNMIVVVFTDPGKPITVNPPLLPTSLRAFVQNIQFANSSTNWQQSYLVSTVYTLLEIAGTLFVVSLAAYEFALFRFPGRRVLFFLGLSGMMVPTIITLIPVYKLVVSLGWLNSLQGLVIPGLASAFGLFMMTQFMESLPRELIDAASMDGASHFMIYWRIILPLSGNALVTLGVLTFIATWSSYAWPLLIVSDPNWYPVSLMVTQFLGLANKNPINLQLTVSFLSVLPPIIFYIFLQRYIIRGIALSGTKG